MKNWFLFNKIKKLFTNSNKKENIKSVVPKNQDKKQTIVKLNNNKK